MESENMFTGEHFIVLDKRNKQALLRGILEIEQLLSPEDLQQLQGKRHPLIQGVLRLEREYVRFDTVLMGVAQRMEDLAGAIRDLLGGNTFDEAKSALYKTILPPQDSNGPMCEEQFIEWRHEFQEELL
jgi:hypothetical protein